MNQPKICFAIISHCHVIITNSHEWHHNKQLDGRILEENNLPLEFKKIVDCGYEFNCSQNKARQILSGLGFRESETLGESRILDNELIF